MHGFAQLDVVLINLGVYMSYLKSGVSANVRTPACKAPTVLLAARAAARAGS